MLEALYAHEYYWLIVSIVAFLSGIIGAMGGSGGLIITPFMMVTGMPPQMAIGTLKFSSLGMWMIALVKFRRADKIKWSLVPSLSALALIGGAIGSLIVLNLDEKAIYPVIGTLLLLLAPLGLLNKKFGIENTNPSTPRKTIGYILYFLVMVFGGFFGGGAGILVIFTLVSFMGLTALQAHATDTPPWVLLTIVSSMIFAWMGQIDYMLSISLFLTMSAGGWVGTHLAIKGGDILVKTFVCFFSVAVGLKILWDFTVHYF